jgi:hypothetical protein
VVLADIKKWFRYLMGKRSELQDLDAKDLLLAKAILDIHRKRTHNEFIMVPLFQIKQIHRIDREASLRTTRERADVLTAHRGAIIEKKKITREFLGEYLPSVSWIKVVKERDESYIAYEGNGRLVAMQQVFEPGDGIHVEVELYHFKNRKKILRRVNRVRKMNGLLKTV